LSEGKAWIFGYWSGLNTLNDKGHLTGNHTDSAGIVGEVKKLCDDHPSMGFSDAILAVYTAMTKGK
jgi:hypothetical protein